MYAVEREIEVERENRGETFADRLDEYSRSAAPTSLFGRAVAYARNRWATLVRYVDDERFVIDNGAAKRAISPVAIGRGNRLHVSSDGGLQTASVQLSVCASATRHRLNPWSSLRDVINQLAGRSGDGGMNDSLPGGWAGRHDHAG